MLTQAELKEILNYDLDTEVWTWKVDRSIKVKAGDRAGTIDPTTGYRKIGINGKKYQSSRLAYFYMTGKWPEHTMDHKNRIRDDDRWCNLKPATKTEQQRNRGMQKNNNSGHTGVSWHKPTKKWMAQIKVDKKRIHLGLFDNLEEAVAFRKEAELKYWRKGRTL